ncbi:MULTISPECIES: hypothetical protein [Hydrocarboniphaga]|nr:MULTISPECIES: hypothetical protein [Hydrocarboniphaga]
MPNSMRLLSGIAFALLASCKQQSEPGSIAPGPASQPPTAESPQTQAVPGSPADAPASFAETAPIGFEGFGPAHFGDDEESVRQSWGRPLKITGTDQDSCRLLIPEPRIGSTYRIVFMLEDKKLVRYVVDVDQYLAPGGLKVGASADEVLKAYAGHVEAMPHKYVEGAQYLVVTPPQGGDKRLLFETDAQGKVIAWRIGLMPQVMYVEGCS